MALATFVIDSDSVCIPDWVEDLTSFRRWAHSERFPEKVPICFLKGEVWVDMSKEQFFSHNQIKSEYGFVLTGLAKAAKSGRYIPDGMLLTNVEADLSCNPDGAFATYDCFRTDRIRLIEGAEDGCVELEGTPDMVLEVVSTSSVEKDTVILRDLYWQAGIQEYWLVDARGDRIMFDILRHTAKGYVATRKQAGGWVKSNVFGKSFRLTQELDEQGNPEYTLEVR